MLLALKNGLFLLSHDSVVSEVESSWTMIDCSKGEAWLSVADWSTAIVEYNRVMYSQLELWYNVVE